MTTWEVLVQLVRSLTKNEKRSFRLGKNPSSDYMELFNLIDKEGVTLIEDAKERLSSRPNSNLLSVTVNYLCKLILDKLLLLRQNRSDGFSLMMQLLKAQILFEKSIFPAAISMLDKIKVDAEGQECQEPLLLASRLELDYLQYLNMPGITETELIQRQYQLHSTLRGMENLYEQSALYELLKHRVIYKGMARTEEDKLSLNDLILKEQLLSRKLAASVESQRRHLLFQSTFLMAVGDEFTASDVLKDLNALKTDTSDDSLLFSISVMENLLDNLRRTGRYERLPQVIEALGEFQHPSQSVGQHIRALQALYRFLPLVDHGDFTAARLFLERTPDLSADVRSQLNPSLEGKISLYVALMYIGLRDYKSARRTLVHTIMHRTMTLPIHRIIRITNLIIHHKMNDLDYIAAESRSIKRELAKSDKGYKMESLILEVVGKGNYAMMSSKRRESIWEKIRPRLDEIRTDVFEGQLLKIFDFSAWIEAEVRRVSFSETLRTNLGIYNDEAD